MMGIMKFYALIVSCIPVVFAGDVCENFSVNKKDLGVCSYRDRAEIWNSTSGELLVSMETELKPVSYSSLVFTAGVVYAVRRKIGKECWDYVPEDVATWILTNEQNFDVDAECKTYPINSPSLGWDARYEMETLGYNDCSALVDLHENSLIRCGRYKADERGFATFGYMIAILIGLIVFFLVCTGACTLCCDQC